MPKKLELQKHTLNYRKGDVAALQEWCSGRDLEASRVIRLLVSNFVDEHIHKTKVPQDKLGVSL